MIGGVGQRVLAGVAKKTAGEFFKAVDGVLTGVAPAVPGPRPEPRELPGGMPAQYRDRAEPGLFTAPGAAAPGPSVGFLRGAAFGAAVALAGVVVGGFVVRRRG
jgi:uncharacterized protein